MNKKAWIICLSAIFGGISMAFLLNKVAPVIPILMRELGISMSTAGLLSSIFSLMGVIIAIPAAIIITKMGIKKAGILSLIVAIIGSFIGVFTENITILIISRIIEGVGVGLIAVIVPTLISMWFKPEKRGFPMGVWAAWMTISSSLAFFISTPITNSFGWKGLWWLGIIMCFIALILYIFIVDVPSSEESATNISDELDDKFTLGSLKHISPWTLALSAILFTFISFSFGSWIAPYWMEVTNWSEPTILNGVALVYFAEIAFAVLVGYILDRVKNRKRFGVVGFILYGIIGAICFYVKQPTLIIIAAVLFPIFDALVPSVFWTIAPQTHPNVLQAGVSIAILNVGLNLGQLLSSPVTGAIAENFGWNAFAIIVFVVGLIGAFFLSRVTIYEETKE